MKNIAIVLVLVFGAATGFSQCNAHRVTARNEMHSSSVVIVGTVTAIVPVAESWDFLNGVNYIVRVDSVLHGKTHRNEYTVFSEDVPNAFNMVVGSHYVLYLQPHFDRYEVNNCGNSHPTEEQEASVRQISTVGY